MQKKKAYKGFTMAELLIVVAIMTILGGVAFIAVIQYQKSLTQLERNSIAKEIFVAAQNHLTMAESQDNLGLDNTNYGDADPLGEENVYCITVNDGESIVPAASQKMFDLILPFGAVDQTVRGGGSYIIRYQVNDVSSRIQDVYYMPSSGRYRETLGLDAVGTSEGRNADGKKEYGDGGILGYYGGEEALNIPKGEKLDTPKIEIINADKLLVKVTDPNISQVAPGQKRTKSDATLQLVITGETSEQSLVVYLREGSDYKSNKNPNEINDRIQEPDDQVITFTLDDITEAGKHFSNISTTPFIPGENITVEARAFSTSEFTNIAYSGEKTTNSLFADVRLDGASTDDKPVAIISNIRHLENLDGSISNVDPDVFNMEAHQINDLDWENFASAKIYEAESGSSEIYSTEEGCYMPVNPSYRLIYDGKKHSLCNFKINETRTRNEKSAAGLFGSLNGSDISNLKLINFDVQSSTDGDAGSLVGTMTDTSVSNVIAFNRERTEKSNVKSNGNAGGLIGTIKGGSVKKCAAAVYVSSTDTSGGLIGKATGNCSISYSYSGGHTYDGEYPSGSGTVYDVSSGNSGTAGGLVGLTNGTSILGCYSTCSVEGGDNAGGLVGNNSGSVQNCYATGFIPNNRGGALIGNYKNGDIVGCHYYEIINEITQSSGVIDYLPPVGKGETEEIKAIDANVSSFEEFIGNVTAAEPYDWKWLSDHYQTHYFFKNVAQLKPEGGSEVFSLSDLVYTHYGDWPSPEVFVLNEAS